MNEFEELRKNWMDIHEFKEKYEIIPVEEYPNRVLKSIPEPKVSVHIITYQHINYICEAIDSVLMQETDFPFEIIIGDDESTDGTREICIEYAEKYPDKIRLFLHKRENNIAIMGNRSHVFQYTFNSFQLRGDYVAVCSGDDYWTDPLKLQKQCKFLEENAGYSYCYHTWSEVNDGLPAKSYKTDWTGTVMNINFYSSMPKEILQSFNEDELVKQILILIGKNMFLSGVEPSVHRIHGGNMWASKNHKFHLIQYENMSLAIMQVFLNTERKQMYIRDYLDRSLTNLLYRLSKNFSFSEIRNWFSRLFEYGIVIPSIFYLPVILLPKVYKIIGKRFKLYKLM